MTATDDNHEHASHSNDDYHAGFMAAVRKFERYGDSFTGEDALTDEERYVLAQAAEFISSEAEFEREEAKK